MFGHLLDSPRTKYLAALASLSIGLFFTFVWAPHPWTWNGIDQYHDLARAVVRGEGFMTTDVPWGYTYYAAFFYKVFGERVWIPIVVQVILNATMPLMLYAIVRPLAGQRTATLAALLTGVLSFNTIYASTQASDSICSFVFLAAVLCFMRAHANGRLSWFVLSGLLLGLATQFRPNLILLPAVVAALYIWPLNRRRIEAALAFVAAAALVVMPWVVRNYRLAGVILPTSSHGAVQLWYGSLQVGPYLEDRSVNPRAVLEQSPFDYTSLIDTPIIISIDPSQCAANVRDQLAVTYWTDRSADRITVPVVAVDRGLEARLPGQPDPTTVYWTLPGVATPFVFFVSSAHTRNLDTHEDFDDAFDVMALLTRPGSTVDDVGPLVVRLLDGQGTVARVDANETAVTMHLSDGSTWRVPRDYDGDASKIDVDGPLAARLMLASLRRGGAPILPDCLVGRVGVNRIFYRRELHTMRRYAALAFDNISRQPIAFAAAAAYRTVRLFVVRPSGATSVTYKFSGAQLIYAGAMLVSLIYLLAFLAGVWAAWVRRSALLPLAVPIVYVPLTIAFVLTNQRYTVTVQPLMFAFVSFAIVTLMERRKGVEP